MDKKSARLHPDTSCQLLCPVINIAMTNNKFHTAMCKLHDFLSSKLDLCIRTLLQDQILTLKKNTPTPTPRVHLVLNWELKQTFKYAVTLVVV